MWWKSPSVRRSSTSGAPVPMVASAAPAMADVRFVGELEDRLEHVEDHYQDDMSGKEKLDGKPWCPFKIGGERERRSGHQVMTIFYTHICLFVKEGQRTNGFKPLLALTATSSCLYTSALFGVAVGEHPLSGSLGERLTVAL